MNAPSPQRRRRQAAVPQAAIARAGRVAQSLGPTWRVEVEGDVVRLYQGDAPTIAVPVVARVVRDFSL